MERKGRGADPSAHCADCKRLGLFCRLGMGACEAAGAQRREQQVHQQSRVPADAGRSGLRAGWDRQVLWTLEHPQPPFGDQPLIDGAQAISHMAVDVQDLGCDFYAFSSHKMYGPTGVGVLYGREQLLDRMPPWQGGGEMILAVTFAKTTYNALPNKFEAGTPNISGGIGLGAAVDFLSSLDLEAARAHEETLLHHATATLSKISGLRIVGTAPEKASLVSFVVAGVHPHDLGTILDEDGIAVRTGHHCAMPVMDFFKLPATARASFAFYNTFGEVDRLAAGIERARKMFI